MHVLIVPSEYPSNDHELGGIFVKEQRDALNKKIDIGVIHIYLFSIFNIFRIDTKDYYNFSKLNKFYRISFLRFPKLKLINFYMHYFFFDFIFKRYVFNHGLPDLIHAHFSEFTSYTLLKIKKKYNIPYVITEHSTDFLDKRFLAKYPKKSKSFRIVKKSFEQAKYVISVSSFLEKKIKEIFKIKKLKIIHNFTKKLISYHRKKYDFIFVGDLIDRKNPFLLLRTFHYYFKDTNKKLAIVGNGKLYNKIYKYINRHNLKNVFLFNKLKREKVLKKIAESKILVSTSKYETFGIVLIEAIANGLQIISTDSGGPRDIVNEFNGIILKKDISEKKLAQSMKILSKLKKNKKKIKSEYIKKFSENTFLKNTLKIYKESIRN